MGHSASLTVFAVMADRADVDRQVKSISVSPDPPVPGKNLTVNVEADVLETVKVGVSSSIQRRRGKAADGR